MGSVRAAVHPGFKNIPTGDVRVSETYPSLKCIVSADPWPLASQPADCEEVNFGGLSRQSAYLVMAAQEDSCTQRFRILLP